MINNNKFLKIGVAQINPKVGDFDYNKKLIIKYLEYAAKPIDTIKSTSVDDAMFQNTAKSNFAVDLLVFPELCVCGYDPRDLALRDDFCNKSYSVVEELVALSVNYDFGFIVGSLKLEKNLENKKRYNSAFFIYKGQILFEYKKRELPNYGIFDEKRLYSSGRDFNSSINSYASIDANYDGFKSVDFRSYKLGLLICEDLWVGDNYESICKKNFFASTEYKDADKVYTDEIYADNAYVDKKCRNNNENTEEKKDQKLDLVITINASPFWVGKHNERIRIIKNQVKKHGVPLLYVNMVGAQDGVVYDGGSMYFDSEGEVGFQGDFFNQGLYFLGIFHSSIGDNIGCGSIAKNSFGSKDFGRKVLVENDISRETFISEGFSSKDFGVESLDKKGLRGDSIAKDNIIKNSNFNLIYKLTESNDIIDGSLEQYYLRNDFIHQVLYKEDSCYSANSTYYNAKINDYTNSYYTNFAPEKSEKTDLGVCENASDTYEKIYDALILGLKDYVKKNNFSSISIGYSSGIDSTLVSLIAIDSVGAENVNLLCLPSMYTSNETVNDSKEFFELLGIKNHKEVPINKIYDSFIREFAYFEIEGRGLSDDKTCDYNVSKNVDNEIALQNLQARIRGNILMYFANKNNSLLLTTGNKSEIAVGYCTLYGDTNGGFNPIKDLYKTQVYEIAKYRNKNFTQNSMLKKVGIIPENILHKSPSAELKFNQKDSDSLPEYDILDKILILYIEERRSIEEIIEAGFERSVVVKVANLVRASQFKRSQSAIGTKISKMSFDLDFRYPITNGFI